ncbi:MAG: BamA/TamA family outer membrane protein [Gemmatimonadales bacterium]
MRRLLLLVVAAVLLPGSLAAQYFGRNRVQYGRFDFQIVQTEHFDVYFYPAERDAAMDIARMAERSYARLSRVLNHEFEDRKPIIVYASHSDFQQTNLGGGDIDEGTGGFTDFLRHRNTFPLSGSYADNDHVLTHEMVHQFQFDIWSRGRGGAGIQGILSANAPLWFGEGMSEYFSLGPMDTKTAMWLRDGALEGKLPSARDFYQVFPYQFGHALVSYIGQRWGDEAIGTITKNAVGGGLELSLRRVLGMSFEQLVSQWQDAVTRQYLPEIGNRVKARAVAQPLLTEKISEGTWHLAPALSPDGSRVAYFSEKDFFFIDLWLADGNTGKPIRRLLKTSVSGSYESFRYITSSAAWSEDGSMLAFAAKRSGKDDIVIVDPAHNREIRRISVPLSGVTTPTFSPDGTKLVFTGLDGGLSDLFTVNIDGTGLTRLTNDKFSELHPTWSPDGSTIAFATDRGPETDFETLKWGELRLALYHVGDGRIELLPGTDQGRNSNPQWAPDGRSIAFVSDRDNVANLYLYDFGDREVYRLTDFYTGVQGITPLSPVISWARGADRIAFVYFEQGKYDVYSLANPRGAKKEPWRPSMAARQQVLVQSQPVQFVPPPAQDTTPKPPEVLSSASIYRGPTGFRRTDSLGPIPDSLRAPAPVTIAKLLDSVDIPAPDTIDFVHKPYKAKFEPEYVARPTIGYVRDNFGRGVTGSATIVLGDMLSNQQMVFGASLNGRLPETQFLAQYINLKRRLNWGIGIQQQPYFFYDYSSIEAGPSSQENTYITNIQRLVLRDINGIAYYPFSRFSRVEGSLSLANVSNDLLQIREPYFIVNGVPSREPTLETVNLENITYLQPSLAYVYDNSLSAYVGPFMGRRSRFEVAQNLEVFGTGWKFTSVTADNRRYDRIAGNLTLATRQLFIGRMGRDEGRFRFFGGNTELIRGYTAGSISRNECYNDSGTAGSFSGCAKFDELIGTRAAVFNAELRLPLIAPGIGVIPLRGFPGALEGAAFFDAGVFWEKGMSVALSGEPTACSFDQTTGQSLGGCTRTPLTSFGLSLRANLLNFVILRLDYARPLQRTGIGGVWTISLGPTF